MCGIAGIIHRNQAHPIGKEMSGMLQALKHRGQDSCGFSLYGEAQDDIIIMRLKLAEPEELRRGFAIHKQVVQRNAEVDKRLAELHFDVKQREKLTEYALRYEISSADEASLRKLSMYLEDIKGVEILSLGNKLELIKDLGDANTVSTTYRLDDFKGTHAIGHTRMATESAVDIRSAHPYWAYPFLDVSVVHNGQLTNYWSKRRELERRGHRFVSNCDSELIAVYIAERINRGDLLKSAIQDSLKELDGVFTYLVATADELGMGKDTMSAKPLVVYESDDVVALASEEIAIRSLLPQEIDTYDPYDGEIKVWST